MNRRQMLAGVVSYATLQLLGPLRLQNWLVAAEIKEVPTTITKKDGTTVRGKITNYDRDKVTIEVILKPKDAPVSTEVPWSQIKQVSNGLTYEKAVQKWKAENRNDLCEGCHGDGKVFCSTCHGTGHDPAASANCPQCKGAAQLGCTTPKCDKGIIPCPNPKCLRPVDSSWVKHPDGSKWKRFNIDGKSHFEVGEGHVGEIVEKVNGQWQVNGPCPVCGKATTITDPVCRGTHQIPCPSCSKNTKSPACPDKCQAGLVECPTCKGKGTKT